MAGGNMQDKLGLLEINVRWGARERRSPDLRYRAVTGGKGTTTWR